MSEFTPLQDMAIEWLTDVWPELVHEGNGWDAPTPQHLVDQASSEAHDLISDGVRCADDAHSIGYLLDMVEGIDEIALRWDEIVLQANRNLDALDDQQGFEDECFAPCRCAASRNENAECVCAEMGW